MALSQGSIITISEINAEFDTKIDSAGTGLSKSGTSLSLAPLHSASGSAGPTANATPAYGATFTVPQINYDTYGRVTGYTNRTVKIPAAPSVTSINGAVAYCKITGTSKSAYTKNLTHNITYGSIFQENWADSDSYWPDYHYQVPCTIPSGGTWICVGASNARNNISSLVSGGVSTNLNFYRDGDGSNTKYTAYVCFLRVS